MKKEKGTLSYYEIFAYGTGGIFINLAGVGDQFGMYFLTNVALLPSAVVGIMMMITTCFDAVNDPIIGSMADQNATRIGKYRPFLIFGGLLTGLISVLRFTNPDIGQSGKIVYYMVLMLLYSVGFTACSIPWQAMMSVLSPNYNERNVLLSVRSISGNVTGMAVNAVILVAVASLGGAESGGWWKFMAIAWVFACPFIFICQHGMRRVDHQGSIPNPPKQQFFRRVGHVLRHKPVLYLCLAIAISSLIISMSSISEMYYYEYVVGDVYILTKTSVASFPITIGCAFLLPFILKVIDKRYMILIAFGISLIKPICIMAFGANIPMSGVVALIVISRAGTAFLSASIYAWVPECVDYTNWKDGITCAGLITAATTFMMKLGRAGGQSLTGWLMAYAGFDATKVVTEQVIGQILHINGLYSVIGFCLTIVPILLFPISRQKANHIREELTHRD